MPLFGHTLFGSYRWQSCFIWYTAPEDMPYLLANARQGGMPYLVAISGTDTLFGSLFRGSRLNW